MREDNFFLDSAANVQSRNVICPASILALAEKMDRCKPRALVIKSALVSIYVQVAPDNCICRRLIAYAMLSGTRVHFL